MRFILYQNAAHWFDPISTIQNIEEGLFSMKGSWQKNDILVLPEMFSTGFVTESSHLSDKTQVIKNQEYTLNWMCRFSQEHQITVTGSLPYWNGELLFNSLMIIKEGNKSPIFYNKRHLFGIAGEKLMYSAGGDRTIYNSGEWRMNLSICYDLRFPVWLRNKNDYDILICIANWPVGRANAWRSLLIARAIENQCYVFGVNRVGNDSTGTIYSGGSLVVGPDGVVLHEMNDDVGFLCFEPDASFLSKFRRAYPFLKDCDDFTLI